MVTESAQCAAVVDVSEMLTRLMSLAFCLSFLYDFFVTLTSQALRLLYLLENYETRPVITQPLRHCMTRFT
jgi:hypothetical protein